MSEPIPAPEQEIARRTAHPLPTRRHLPGEGSSDFEPVFDFAYGCDLFDLRYYFEAHEVWEHEWRSLPTSDPDREFLQGLICAAAFALKKHQGLSDAADRLLDRATRLLKRHTPSRRGLDTALLLQRLQQFHAGGPWVLLPPA